jgi:hypothetical protein
MHKPVFLITRYSVVGKAQHTWNLAREASSHSDYKARLLAPERLRARLSVFRSVTIPSILAQLPTDAELHWIILIAADLPAEQLAELSEALAPVERGGVSVSLVKVADSDEAADVQQGVYPGMGMAARLAITAALGDQAAVFASVRLDDDDALAAGYLSALSPYLAPEFVGKHVSFPRGIQAVYSPGARALTDARVVDKPLIALGLAFINSFDGNEFFAPEVHVLNFGNHSDVIAKTTVINDRGLLAYLRVLTETSDLGDGQQLNHPPASRAEIASLGLPLRVRPAKKKLGRRAVRP